METILVLDPDPDLLEIICLALEMENFKTTRFHNVNADLLHLIQSSEPDLVLLDFSNAGTFCKTSCRTIKYAYPNLPVIALSRNNNIHEIHKDHGFDNCISKPFDLEELYTMVKTHLYLSRLGCLN